MKIRYLILGISFLLVGLTITPIQSHASGQTSINFVVSEDDDEERIQEIDKEPLDASKKDSNNRQQARTTSDQKTTKQGMLPSTNEKIFYGLSLAGIVICLIVVVWKYKNYSKMTQ